jgi:uncharacterized membrane protein
MASQLYDFLMGIGYHHPLHPALTHLPVGLTIASFIFIALAYFFKGVSFIRTAKHCVILALLAAIPTVIFGYLDWQHFYAGAFLFPIKMKLGLAFILIALLAASVIIGLRNDTLTTQRMFIHLFALLVVTGLGYFGGELVYGQKASPVTDVKEDAALNASIVAGANLFKQSCSFCHLTDSTATKIGPGLQGLFKKEKMPVSGWPVSADSVKRQLQTPYQQMPPFLQLTSEEITSLTDFLKSL